MQFYNYFGFGEIILYQITRCS